MMGMTDWRKLADLIEAASQTESVADPNSYYNYSLKTTIDPDKLVSLIREHADSLPLFSGMFGS